MCIHVCIYIYIYIWMYVCGSLCVVGGHWNQRDSYLQHFWMASHCLEGLPLSVYFGMKTTQRAVPVWTRETGSKGWQRPKMSVKEPLKQGAKETSSKLSLRLRAKESCSQQKDAAIEMDDDDQRWPSILRSCLGFSLSSHNSLTYMQSAKKHATDFTFLCYAVSNLCFAFSSFLPLFFVSFFFFFFVQLVKCPLGQV